jgi:hypothetical protein
MFVENPITFKQEEVPADIIQYCDSFTLHADHEDLRYLDCVWMHMGYYGVPKSVMKAHRDEWNPPVIPVFD